jgi:glutamine amidotransferase PdxT
VTTLPSEQALDYMNATGIVMAPSVRKVSALIRDAQRVIFHTFNPRRPQEYIDRGTLYVQHHGQKVETNEDIRLGGPGLVTLAWLDGLDALQRLKAEHSTGTHGSPQDRLMEQVLDQPVLVRVENANDVLTPQTKEKVFAHAVQGFVFQSPDDILRFHAAWKAVPLRADERMPLGTGITAHPEPSVLLEASPETLLRFFAEAQNFVEGNPCDGYIVTEPLSPDDAERIWDARVERIASAHRTPLAFPEGVLRVGVLNLQGASKMESWLLEQARQQVLTWMNVRIEMVHTREEIENLHGLIFPGGWHGPQLMLYNDQRLGINEAVRDAISEDRLAVLFSCAGAIGAGNPKKERIDCSQHPPSNFLDYGIRNNVLNGEIHVRCKQQNGATWEDRTTTCVGAPIFLNPNPEQLGIMATTLDHAPVALRKRTSKEKPPIYAASIHSPWLESEWLEELGRSQAEKRRKGVQD